MMKLIMLWDWDCLVIPVYCKIQSTKLERFDEKTTHRVTCVIRHLFFVLRYFEKKGGMK